MVGAIISVMPHDGTNDGIRLYACDTVAAGDGPLAIEVPLGHRLLLQGHRRKENLRGERRAMLERGRPEAARRKPRLQDGGAAGPEHRQERPAKPDHMEQRQRDQAHILAPMPVDLRAIVAGPQNVRLSPHDALRLSGRAGREHDGCRVGMQRRVSRCRIVKSSPNESEP